MFLHSYTFVHSTLISILNKTGSFNKKWRKLKVSAFCPRSHWKSCNEFPMVKHLSSFPPSGNDSHCQDFRWLCLMKPISFWSVLPATTSYLQMSVLFAAGQSTLNKVYLLLLREDWSVAPFAKSTGGYFFRTRFEATGPKGGGRGRTIITLSVYHTGSLPNWFLIHSSPASIVQREVTQLGAKRMQKLRTWWMLSCGEHTCRVEVLITHLTTQINCTLEILSWMGTVSIFPVAHQCPKLLYVDRSKY